MGILDKIVNHKKEALMKLKQAAPESSLLKSEHFERATVSMCESLKNRKPGIIAEFKRKSPSKQEINLDADPEGIAKAYEANGAAAISVLTDEHFFGAHSNDFSQVRNTSTLPVLRKDFMIDPYQIIEAKSMGADVILLIAEVLSKSRLKVLASLAKELKLEVLMEVHSTDNLKKICDEVDIVGVNNRDLSTFKTDAQHSVQLFESLPSDRMKISESGISDATTVKRLSDLGYNGFLIGEHFMRASDPGASIREFIKSTAQ